MHVLSYISTIVLLASATIATISSRHKRLSNFAADPSINVTAIFAAAKSARGHLLASFASTQGNPNSIPIFGDWRNLPDVSVIYWTGAMAVDCDGVDFQCPNNPDGQPQTSFGRLSATRVPFYVIPELFSQKANIKPNALGAIICNGKMFYGIFGDQNGDNPPVLGEASILMARTCFPNENLDGGKGWDRPDVLYLVFPNDVPNGVGEVTINIGALKALGDQQIRKLAAALGI